jgi:hypothetical protein
MTPGVTLWIDHVALRICVPAGEKTAILFTKIRFTWLCSSFTMKDLLIEEHFFESSDCCDSMLHRAAS